VGKIYLEEGRRRAFGVGGGLFRGKGPPARGVYKERELREAMFSLGGKGEGHVLGRKVTYNWPVSVTDQGNP